MDALLERIASEEAAKQQICACTGCTNKATHTWSGYPTCDECGTPGRTELPLPVIYDMSSNAQVNGDAEPKAERSALQPLVGPDGDEE